LLADKGVCIGIYSVVFRINITVVKCFLTSLAIISRNLGSVSTAMTSFNITLSTSNKLLGTR